MASIHKTFQTNSSAEQMREFVTTSVLTRKEVAIFFGDATWEGNTLKINSTLGEGTMSFRDNEVEINVELSFFGGAAKSTIEDELEKQFKKLTAGKPE
jgi:hypothetical protein